MPGVLQDTSGILSYWHDRLQPADLHRFKAQTGDPKHNTLWAAPAVLVSLRARRRLFTRSTPVSVSSDNLGALAVLQQHSTQS
eukprot:4362013-Alexandrium_andersonii.AAC.1